MKEKCTIKRDYMKELFFMKSTQYFGLIELVENKKMSCQVEAIEEDTILLQMNKTDVFSCKFSLNKQFSVKKRFKL